MELENIVDIDKAIADLKTIKQKGDNHYIRTLKSLKAQKKYQKAIIKINNENHESIKEILEVITIGGSIGLLIPALVPPRVLPSIITDSMSYKPALYEFSMNLCNYMIELIK